jgi:hypothetical protein
MKIKDDLKENIVLGQALVSGHDALKTDVNVPEGAEAMLRVALAEARKQEKHLQASRSKRAKTVVPALRLAQEEGLESITTAKGVLRLEEGPNRNLVWEQAGFVKSIQTPGNWTQREALLLTLATFLEENPRYENAAKNFTAAIVLQRATALSQAILNVDAHDSQHAILAELREAAKKELVFRIRGFIKELRRVLADDDSRWKTYRLESPATERSLRPDRKERAESKTHKRAAKRVQSIQEKADKMRERMEKLKRQLAKLENTTKAEQPTKGTGSITSIAA